MPTLEPTPDPLAEGGEVSPGIPGTLYHYTSPDGIKGIVEEGALYCSSAHYLSDAAELRYAARQAEPLIEDLERRVQEEGPEYREEFDLLDRMKDELGAIEEERIFVCSFSSNGNMLSQWRAYCPEEGGYSVGFDTDRLAALADIQGFHLFRCLYSADEYAPALEDLVYGTIPWYREHRQELEESRAFGGSHSEDLASEHATGFRALFVNLAARVKHPAFKEEDEWRLVSAPIAATMYPVSYRSGVSSLVPYIEFELEMGEEDLDEGSEYDEMDLRCPISEVIVGPTPHPELAGRSVEGLLNAHDLYGRGVTESGIPYRTW